MSVISEAIASVDEAIELTEKALRVKAYRPKKKRVARKMAPKKKDIVKGLRNPKNWKTTSKKGTYGEVGYKETKKYTGPAFPMKKKWMSFAALSISYIQYRKDAEPVWLIEGYLNYIPGEALKARTGGRQKRIATQSNEFSKKHYPKVAAEEYVLKRLSQYYKEWAE